MIELKDVTKEYSKGIAALNGISLTIEQGEFVFIVGDSGSGKSTLIRLLMKELDPTSGTITVMGEDLGKMKHKHIPKYRRRIGVVFQDFRLLKDRNVYENIAFALRVTEAPTRIIKQKVPAALSLVGLAQSINRFRRSCQEENSSVWRSRERSSMSRLFCWQMSRPVTWTRLIHGRS